MVTSRIIRLTTTDNIFDGNLGCIPACGQEQGHETTMSRPGQTTRMPLFLIRLPSRRIFSPLCCDQMKSSIS